MLENFFGRKARMAGALAAGLAAAAPDAQAKLQPIGQDMSTQNSLTNIPADSTPDEQNGVSDEKQIERDTLKGELDAFENYFSTHVTRLAVDNDDYARTFVKQCLHVYGMNAVQALTSPVAAIADQDSFQKYVLQSLVLEKPDDFQSHKQALEEMAESVSKVAKAWLAKKKEVPPESDTND